MRGLIYLILAVGMATGALAADVVSLSNAWAAAWSAKDMDAIMQLYAPEPVFLANSGERWEGVDTIRTNFAMGLSEFTPRRKLHSARSASSGNLAYDSGTYDEIIMPMRGGGVSAVRGNYLFVFQRQKDGAWKILEQTFTQYDPGKL